MCRYGAGKVRGSACANYHYFPSAPELLITFGIIAAEVAIYIAVVKTFPILGGSGPGPARSKA